MVEEELNLDHILDDNEIIINASSFNDTDRKINENLQSISILQDTPIKKEIKIDKKIPNDFKYIQSDKRRYFTDILDLINNNEEKQNFDNDILSFKKKFHKKHNKSIKYSNLFNEIKNIEKRPPSLTNYNIPNQIRVIKDYAYADKLSKENKFNITTRPYNKVITPSLKKTKAKIKKIEEFYDTIKIQTNIKPIEASPIKKLSTNHHSLKKTTIPIPNKRMINEEDGFYNPKKNLILKNYQNYSKRQSTPFNLLTNKTYSNNISRSSIENKKSIKDLFNNKKSNKVYSNEYYKNELNSFTMRLNSKDKKEDNLNSKKRSLLVFGNNNSSYNNSRNIFYKN